MKVCNTCLELDGVEVAQVAEELVTNDLTGAQFLAFVCKRCFSLGRTTRVTCKTFSKVGYRNSATRRELEAGGELLAHNSGAKVT